MGHYDHNNNVGDLLLSESHYKKHNTVTYLIAISPSGFITFLSDSYGGRTSDQQICQDSTFYKKLEYGDEIMADQTKLQLEHVNTLVFQ